MRQRACGVVFRDDKILMVRHVHHGRDYWTLPGGGVHDNESLFEAAEREVLEETGIQVSAVRLINCHETERSLSHCILMTAPPASMQATLGIDPEEKHLPEDQRILREVAWIMIENLRDDPMVSQVLNELDQK